MTRHDVLAALRNKHITPQEAVERLQALRRDAHDVPAQAPLLLAPQWQPLAAPADAAPRTHWLLLCAPEAGLAALDWPQAGRVVTLPVEAEAADVRFEQLLLQVFDTLSAAFGDGGGETAEFSLLVHEREVGLWQGIAALLQSIRHELPALRARVVVLAADWQAAALRELLARPGTATALRLAGAAPQQLGWEEPATAAAPPPWRADGTYVISGGGGGLGLLFAREIADCAPSARIVLLGRSAPGEAVQRCLTELGAGAASVEYHALDSSDRGALQTLFARLVQDARPLRGILHCAGVLRDGYFVRKSREDLRAVFAPKVRGAVALDAASRDLPLDFFALFSSLAGALGSSGQSDYAAANGFLDGFAAYRNGLAERGERSGRCVALDWPLWQDGGMQVDALTIALTARASGLQPIATRAGFDAFYRGLAAAPAQLLVLSGERERLRQTLLGAPAAAAAAPSPGTVAVATAVAAMPVDAALLQDRVVQRLKNLFSQVTLLRVDQIDKDEPVERYGIDSIAVTRLNTEFEQVFGALSKTLLYEYATLARLAAYFCARHRERCVAWCGLAAAAAPAARPLPAAAGAATPFAPLRSFRDAAAAPRALPRAADSAAPREGIAIIGISLRLPGADDLEQFWLNLRAGRDGIAASPGARWSAGDAFESDMETAVAHGKIYVLAGGFLDGYAEFDPLFFGISRREAFSMDPHERLFLESCWGALEDAGYTRERLALRHQSRVGVFAGITKTGYEHHGHALGSHGEPLYPLTSFSSVANRVSYVLDLKGPSMPVDTMCSSSLTAIHEACEHLYRDECELALAGGVNLYLHPSNYAVLCAQRMLSPSGRCHSFGIAADGFVPGEGVATLLLKRLSAAERDGDLIYALVCGTAINHGGKTNGYTVPNPASQAQLVRAALDRAGRSARQVSYIEAHGTGTRLGDPIEISGLSQAFAADTADQGFCAIGSLKSNIGHLEAAAGVAGLIKVVLQLRHGEFAPSLHADALNPNIDFARSPFVLQRGLAPWPRTQLAGHGEAARLAGISSFGAGGSNAHVLVEEYLGAAAPLAAGGLPALIVLSARDAQRLEAQVQRLRAALVRFGDADLPGIAYTLQTGREAMEERLALQVQTCAELAAKLDAVLAGTLPDGCYRGQVARNRGSIEVLDQDEDLRALVASWLAGGKQHKLLELWVKGLSFDWETLYPAQRPARVRLPTYPFAREVFWLAPDAAAVPAAAAAPRVSASLTGGQLLGLHWAETALPAAGDAALRRSVMIGGTALAQRSVVHKYSNVLHLAVEAGQSVDELAAALAAAGDIDHIVWVLPAAAEARLDAATLVQAQEQGVVFGFRLVKALLQLGYAARALRWTVITWRALPVAAGVTIDPAHAGVHGLIGALAKEQPQWQLRLADLEREQDWRDSGVLQLPADPRGRSWAFREGRWLREQLLRVTSPPPGHTYRQGGVYVVIGGAGHVGQVWTEALLRNHGARVAWIGRRAADASLQHSLERLGRLGPEPIYIAADAADAASLAQALEEVERRCGRIAGIVSAAMVMQPAALADLDETALRAALAAKVQVALHIADACAERALDFILFFSSLVSSIKNPAQAHYAAGCVFADAFAAALRQRWAGRAQAPQIKVMNWGFWNREEHRHGGLGEELARVGIGMIEPAESLRALDALMAWPVMQLGFMKLVKPVLIEGMAADRELRIDAAGATVAARQAPAAPAAVAPAAPFAPQGVRDDDALRESLEQVVRRRLGEVLVLQPHEILPARAFAEYGLDSVSGTRFVGQIGADLGLALDPTLIFDHACVDDLVEHLARTHGAVLALAPAAVADVVPAASTPAAATALPAASAPAAAADIAVIGMSGRFAQARDVDELWTHLAAGRDLVAPVERWDLAAMTAAAPRDYHASLIDGIDEFDPLFFSISGIEAQYMDPNQRLFLQQSWHALEDAAHLQDELHRHRVGIYVGVEKGDYDRLIQHDAPGQTMLGNVNSILPARLAYLLDLQGPAIAVDTACSSSLVAVHLGCQALRSGEVDIAICGGSAVGCTPMSYLGMLGAGMLSTRGRCHTFDARADGFAPGEGVAVVVLRRLGDALADRDNLHGVIRGSATNQDGATNGITAPSAKSQERLQRDVYERFGIDPAHIGYVEAHGTGTVLGDPIEFNALSRSFGDHGMGYGYCALGSLKTNIGHAKAAAGIAGLIKVLLCLRHRQLPPSLHFEAGNPTIDFAHSPFFVNTTLREWRPTAPGRPLLAALNSFGMSGTNAHVVVAEAPPLPPREGARAPACLMLLSARNAGQLRDQVQRHSEFIKKNTSLRCIDVSASLLLGRRHLVQRLAWVVADLAEWSALLDAWLRGEAGAQQGIGREVDRNRRRQQTEQAEQWLARARAAVDPAGYRAALAQLAALHVEGCDAPPALLHGQDYRRVSLPGYPFARERYWVPETAPSAPPVAAAAQAAAGEHPLLQRDTSDLTRRRFSPAFSGEEFFLADHIVAGQRVLPGVSYLEMALAALRKAAARPDAAVRLTNTTWVRPFAVAPGGGGLQLELDARSPLQAAFAVHAVAAAADAVPYCQGSAELLADTPAPTLDLAALLAEPAGDTVSRDAYYAAYSSDGVYYGPSFRAIEQIRVMPAQLLVQLRLPDAAQAGSEDWCVHPGLLDSALQAAQVLHAQAGAAAARTPALPFALDRLEVYRRCPAACWARLRFSADSNPARGLRKLDLDIVDLDGNVCLQLAGFSTRPLAAAEAPVSTEPVGVHHTLVPMWEALPALTAADMAAALPAPLVFGADAAQLELLRRHWPALRDGAALASLQNDSIEQIAAALGAAEAPEHLLWFAPMDAGDDLAAAQSAGVLALFRLVKALLAAGYGSRRLCLTAVTFKAQAVETGDLLQPAHAAVHGLVGSLAKEYAHWQLRLFDLPSFAQWPQAMPWRQPADPLGNLRAFRNGEWFVQKLLALRPPAAAAPTPYRDGGVYVVIGGAGGVARTWSEWMIRRYRARIVWIGRRQADAQIDAQIERLAALGPRPLYLAADATDTTDLQRAAAQVRRLGAINGVIHSAIVLADGALANMDEAKFVRALQPKVAISQNIARAFAADALDFVLFFSSFQSFSKAAGQSNYAAGSTFKDAFAQALGRAWPCAVKVMNWGYWGSTGIVADENYRKRMAQFGLGSIEPETAMQAIEALLGADHDQAALVCATQPEFLDGVGADEELGDSAETAAAFALDLSKAGAQISPPDQSWRQALDSCLARLLWVQLNRLECGRTRAELSAAIDTRYGRWLTESLRALGEHGLWQDERLHLAGSEDEIAAWRDWEAAKQSLHASPGALASILLVDATLRALPAILRGEQRATDIMFRGSSVEQVEGVYQGNQTADYYNSVLADALMLYLEQRPDAAPLRILEIGAGTGATSAVLLPRLALQAQRIAEYAYTDISRAFLLHAEERFVPNYAFVRPLLLNAENPLAGQGVEPGSYDVVVATNVLHATENIRQALRNAKAALKRNGLLLLNEISDRWLYNHLTFGLLEGWWRFTDDALRIEGSPALTPQGWQRALTEEGFGEIQFPAERGHAQGQQVIAARSDGRVRQRRAAPVAVVPPRAAPPPRAVAVAPGQGGLAERAGEYLKRLIAETIRIPPHEIDVHTPFERYGIDSILVVRLTNALGEALGSVSSTLFFEYQTVHALTEHLLEARGDALRAALNYRDEAVADVVPAAIEAAPAPTVATAAVVHTAAAALPAAHSDAIAIIGLSGRYPQAADVDAFWDNLAAGRNCISEIPAERRDAWDFFEAQAPGSTFTRWGGFIDGYDRFDAAFFHISPREAETMDPQERLFIEEAYRCIEDAAHTPRSLAASKKVGVFVGVMNAGYPSGAAYYSIANRLSFMLDLQGPSMAIDTACSSSLTALHLAVESLRAGSSDCALAGGVNLVLTPFHYAKLASKRMLSAGDRCKAFGAGADGFVDGEGVGVVLLKPLRRALADGDHIYGLVRGTAVNASGKTNGYTVPNPLAQAELVRLALAAAQLDSTRIGYVEAHGTGTDLGDPIELAGLNRAFGASPAPRCALGSVKTNIGHCESAAGIAGLTKVLLQIMHAQIAPSLHSSEINPKLDFAASPFFVNQTLRRWEPQTAADSELPLPRIAGLSSFGAGGANAHVIIEEYPLAEPAAQAASEQAIVLSARTRAQLEQRARQLDAWLGSANGKAQSWADVAYSLQIGRVPMEHRVGLLANSPAQARVRLRAFLAGKADAAWCQVGGTPQERLPALTADGDFNEMLERWLQQAKLDKLLSLWVRGTEVDWSRLARAVPVRRVRLPTYPFDGKRYWWRWQQAAGTTAGMPPRGRSSASPSAQPAAGQGQTASPSAPSAAATTSSVRAADASPAPVTASRNSAQTPVDKTMNEKPKVKLMDQASHFATEAAAPAQAAPAAEPAAAAPAPPPAAAGQRSLAELRKELVASFAAVLFMEPGEVDENKSFGELGLDSVLAVEWIRDINASYGVALEAIEIYDYPTIRDMAVLVNERLQQASGAAPATTAAAPEPAAEAVPASAEAGKDLESLRRELSESFAAVLFMDVADVGDRKSFGEMGMDSVLAVEWVREINSTYGIAIEAIEIYDYPDIQAMAQLVKERLAGGTPAAPAATVAAHDAPAAAAADAPAGAPDIEQILRQVRDGTLGIDEAERLIGRGR